jgi:hypothetical protein
VRCGRGADDDRGVDRDAEADTDGRRRRAADGPRRWAADGRRPEAAGVDQVGAGVGPARAPACRAQARESVLSGRKIAGGSGVGVFAGPAVTPSVNRSH